MPTPSPCCAFFFGVADGEGDGAAELEEGVVERNLLVGGDAPNDEGGEGEDATSAASGFVRRSWTKPSDFRLTSLDGELIRKLAIPPLPLLPNSSSVLKKPVLFFSRSSLISVKLGLELDDVPVPLVSLLGVRKNQLDAVPCLGEGDDDSDGM